MTLLSRSQVIERLRKLVTDRGFVTMALLRKHDKPVFRSVLVHFDSIAAARRAAGLPAHRQVRGRPTGAWSKARVLGELRRLDRAGGSTKIRDLIAAGRADLLHAAKQHAGGMRRARQLAGVAIPKAVRYESWDKLRVLTTLIDLRRKGSSLARSRVPQPLVSAGIKFFGSWPAAVEASWADYQQERLRRKPYTEAEIIELLRELARTRPEMTPVELYEHSAVSAMRRLFGSVDRAIAAARIEHWPVRKNQTWDRQSVIRELRARAKQNVHTLTVKLHNACVMYFGTVNEARAAAGVPQLLRAPWTKEELIAELRARARHGDFGAELKTAARRLFGSIAKARRVAGVPGPVRVWTRQRVVEALRELVRSGQRTMPPRLNGACKDYFGSVKAACSAARVRWPRRH